ncbi:MAG: hypothetical protein ABI358_07335 [Ginsengibacter sp.]
MLQSCFFDNYCPKPIKEKKIDALELSECLTDDKYKTLQEAISFYEINMRKRAAKAAKESLENGGRMHSEGALDTMLDFYSGH